MFHDIYSFIDQLLGLELSTKDIGVWQMSLRACVVFLLAIGMIRLGDERFMGRSTVLDLMLGIIFGSVVSRAITGTAPFFPTLAASVVLVAMHWTFSAIAFRSRDFGRIIKGRPHQLVKDGEIDWNEMRITHISENDLKEALRLHGHRDDLENIESAYLERSGGISIIPSQPAVDMTVASNRPLQKD